VIELAAFAVAVIAMVATPVKGVMTFGPLPAPTQSNFPVKGFNTMEPHVCAWADIAPRKAAEIKASFIFFIIPVPPTFRDAIAALTSLRD
jgi:hypothetical protein